MIDSTLLYTYWPDILRGTLVSLQIAAIGCVVGLSLGTLLALLQTSSHWVLRALVGLYVTLLRGTPMLIQIAFAVFVLPEIGIVLPLFWAATLAIGLNSSAYLSQIIRSGILSVGKGQLEAARVLGFTSWQTTYYIVLPQALRIVLPALTNEFITLIKDSSLASTVGVMELTKEGSKIQNETFNALTVYCIIAGVYLIITSLLSLVLAVLSKRLNHHVADQ